ncbi:MAG: DUF1460 domain-containing protein [Tannerellaceae bacterium]|nr:DUF1460 domain-containing protein [Tannerellaceae bacterium]MCD8265125.1 DUF1460 domain-containing protein [Tannerellaceae bacterium]
MEKLSICKLFVLLFLCSWQYGKAQEQVNFTATDRQLFDKYMATFRDKKDLPSGKLLVETARFFLGTPYVAGTLEEVPEQLVVNLREMDCTTLVENTLALVMTLRGDEPTFEGFCNHLIQIRYREGKINGYGSRLHYMTDWIHNNQQKGIVRDITKEAGGLPVDILVNFMSTHPDSYKQLKNDPLAVEQIASQEKVISSRQYYYIPQDQINKHSYAMQEGDIVCFVTSIKGLDISHVGFIEYLDGRLTFVHASSTGKKVLDNPTTLQEYVQNIKTNTGVMLVRFQQ